MSKKSLIELDSIPVVEAPTLLLSILLSEVDDACKHGCAEQERAERNFVLERPSWLLEGLLEDFRRELLTALEPCCRDHDILLDHWVVLVFFKR